MPRSKRPKRPTTKKTDAEKMETSFIHFNIPEGTLTEGQHIFGFDPGKRNLGWAVFKIEEGEAAYVDSGTLKVKGKPKTENECFIHIDEFLRELSDKYNPICWCWERAIGMGLAIARESLGEVQGLIKLAAYRNNPNTVTKPVTTTCMETILLGSAGRSRENKKTATSEKVKSLFLKELEDRRISGSGEFTHEADAIGCLYGLFKANGIKIKGVKDEGETICSDGD